MSDNIARACSFRTTIVVLFNLGVSDEYYSFLRYSVKKHFNYLYANGERFDMTETDRYTVFADSDPVTIELCLSNIQLGTYKISET